MCKLFLAPATFCLSMWIGKCDQFVLTVPISPIIKQDKFPQQSESLLQVPTSRTQLGNMPPPISKGTAIARPASTQASKNERMFAMKCVEI